MGDAAPVAVMPLGLEVTVKAVIADPPLLAGGVKLTVATALPANAEAAVGAPGKPAGVTVFDAADAKLWPALLSAVTAKVYAVPLVRPGTTMGEAPPDAVMPSGLEVTVKLLIAGQVGRVQTGGVKVIDACALPAVAVPIAGAGGAAAVGSGVTLFEIEEGGPVPATLLAVTVNVYGVPLVRPVMTIGDPAPVAVIPSGMEVTV